MHRNIINDEGGAIAVLTALTLVVIAGVIGMAVDYGSGVRLKAALQSAADASALVAARKMSEGESFDNAKKAGIAYFDANTTRLPKANISFSNGEGNSNTGDSSNNGDSATQSTVTVSAEIPWERTLTKLFSDKETKIQVTSTVSQQTRVVEVIFVADVSYSMGIGATANDILILNRTIGCAFACHTDGTDTRGRAAGARLRIDVIRDAFKIAIGDIQNSKNESDIIRVGLITFSNSVVDKLDPSDNLSDMASQADRITFPASDHQGGTDLHAAADAVTAMIQKRKLENPPSTKYVVIWLTDGIEDTKMVLPGRVGAMDTTIPITSPSIKLDALSYLMTFSTDLCQSMKSEGAIIFVMNTEYVTDGYSSVAGGLIKQQLLPIMPSRLTQCTGNPDYVKSASDPQGILDAVRAFAKLAISAKPRISS